MDVAPGRPETRRRRVRPVRSGSGAVGRGVWRPRVRGLQAPGDGGLCPGSGAQGHGNAADRETERSHRRRKEVRV